MGTVLLYELQNHIHFMWKWMALFVFSDLFIGFLLDGFMDSTIFPGPPWFVQNDPKTVPESDKSVTNMCQQCKKQIRQFSKDCNQIWEKWPGIKL